MPQSAPTEPVLEAPSPRGRGDRLQRAPALVVGLLAWSLTVLPLANAPDAPVAVSVSAGIAILALLAAALTPRGFWTLLFGVDLFLVASGATWLLGGMDEPLPAPTTLGLLVWVLFPLAWGALSSPVAGPPPIDPGPPLEPRRRLGSALVLGSVGAGLVALAALLTQGHTGRAEADVLLGVCTLGVAVLSVHTGQRFLEAGASEGGRFSWARLLLRLRGPAFVIAAAALVLAGLRLLGAPSP